MIGIRDVAGDDIDSEIDAIDKLRQIQTEFMILSWIGVSASTIYGFWALGSAMSSNSQSPLKMIFIGVGGVVVFFEWKMYRRIARSVLGERVSEFLPGLLNSGPTPVEPQMLQTRMIARKRLVMLILAGCTVFSALLASVILWRFAGLLASVALFSVVMATGLPVIGMFIVLRR